MIKELIERITAAENEAVAIKRIAEAQHKELVENAEVAAAAAVARAEADAKAMYDSIVAVAEKDAEAAYKKTVAEGEREAQAQVAGARIDAAAKLITESLIAKYAG